MKRFGIRRGPGFLALAIAFGLLAGLVVMILWNWLIPALFAGPVLTFWQALGLLLLGRLLFGSFGGRNWRGGYGGPRYADWRERMSERWAQLTPEQRQQMRQQWRRRCGGRWEEPARSSTPSSEPQIDAD
jgi:hypothetical protein